MNFINKLLKINKYKKTSYSQSGEDLIIEYLFNLINIRFPSYMDIGAHHPIKLNNTFIFYKKGCSGILIEPNPDLKKDIVSMRPRDLLLQYGVSDKSSMLTYYKMTSSTLNTFSSTAFNKARLVPSFGEQEIVSKTKIKVVEINSLLKKYWGNGIDLISLDIEGQDESVVKKLNYNKFRPKVFCIETLENDQRGREMKCVNIMKHLIKNDYSVYADTYINTIFVDRYVFKR